MNAAQAASSDKARAAAEPAGGHEAPPPAGVASAADDVAELYRELERLEVALVEERQRSAALLEERIAGQEAQARDIASLEAMLCHVSAERDRLAAENSALHEELAALRRGFAGGGGARRAELGAKILPAADGRGTWRDAKAADSSANTEYEPSRISAEDTVLDRSCELSIRSVEFELPTR
mmetsp:Transcript_36574/g.105381  ORF Transcript_36574/g.105381 Transcript_36574/m.105381 type:complete len:181 (+) Transcript_36574:64-606(+)